MAPLDEHEAEVAIESLANRLPEEDELVQGTMAEAKA